MECQLLSVVVLLLCLQGLQAAVATCKVVTTPAATGNTFASDATCTTNTQLVCVRPRYNPATGEFATSGVKWACGNAATDTGCTGANDCVTCDSAANCNTDTSLYECIKYKLSGDKWTKDSDKQKCDSLDTAERGKDNCRVVTPDHVGALPGNPTTATFCGSKCTDTNTCKTCTSADCNDIDNYKYCKTGADVIKATTALDALKYNFCGSQTDKCKRPVFTGKPLVTDSAVLPGCGACGDAEKCLDCDASGCTDSPKHADYKCYKWTWVTSSWTKSTALKYCADSSEDEKTPFQICNMPKDLADKNEFTSGGCGACTNAETNCKITGAGLNKYETYKCFSWTLTSEKWKPSTEAAECSNTDNTKLCNLPKERNAKTGYTGNGCGACPLSEVTTCLETIPEKNAGNLPTFSVIAAFTALVFTLLI